MNARKARAVEKIAGRERIPASEATEVFGRFPTSGTIEDTLKRHGLSAHDDGTVAAADVLRAIDRDDANRRARRKDRFAGGDLQTRLERTWATEWAVYAGATGDTSGGRFLGEIDCMIPVDEPLAHPPKLLPVWRGASDAPRAFFTVSARWAQILLLRRAGVPIIEPAWAEPARELGSDHARDLIDAAFALDAGQLDVTKPFGTLTAADVTEMAAHPLPVNPVWREWDEASRLGRASWPDVRDAEGVVPAPEALLLRSMRSVHAEQWGIQAVADHLRVKASTVRSYLARGQMPAPDGDISGTPWWWRETITRWRPGR